MISRDSQALIEGESSRTQQSPNTYGHPSCHTFPSSSWEQTEVTLWMAGPWAPAVTVPARGRNATHLLDRPHGVVQLRIELTCKYRTVDTGMPVVLGVAAPIGLHLHHGLGPQVAHESMVDFGVRTSMPPCSRVVLVRSQVKSEPFAQKPP